MNTPAEQAAAAMRTVMTVANKEDALHGEVAIKVPRIMLITLILATASLAHGCEDTELAEAYQFTLKSLVDRVPEPVRAVLLEHFAGLPHS